MPENDDRGSELMQRLQKGDLHALEELIQQWQLPLLKFAYRYVQDESAAADLVQESFVRVHRYRDRYHPGRPFSTWVFSITANLCRNHQRWKSRHAEASLEQAPEPDTRETPRDQLRKKERVARVSRCIGKLPHKLRVAVLLYYYESLTYKEIAQVLGCSPRTVESRLYRARRELTSLLDATRDDPDLLDRSTVATEWQVPVPGRQ